MLSSLPLIHEALRTGREERDFEVVVPIRELNALQKQKARDTRMLLYIACISLLVGGIGIMNIMLATVTERTREIGIRRALGARRSDIIMQFLLETMALTGLGGILGILIGLLCEPAYGSLIDLMGTFAPSVYESLPPSMKGMTPEVVYWSLPVVFAIAVLTGMVFGIYPARKASQMKPVDALRHVA